MSIYFLVLPKRETSRDVVHSLLAPIIYFKSYLQNLEKILNKKPEWAANIPNRSWRRHSAYLACLHERQQDD